MPKTRQQRIAEERAGHAPSPPQVLADKPREPRRTRAKVPSALNTVAEGPAAPVPELPRALVHVWADENRYVYDPSHEFAIPSALVPKLVVFLNELCDHGTQRSVASSSSSGTKVTPSLNGRQLAPSFPISRIEPQLPEPSAPMEPQHASTGIVPSLQVTPPTMETRTSFARTEQPFQGFSEATAPLGTPAHVRSPPQETHRSMTPDDSRPTRIEVRLNQSSYHEQSTRTVNKIAQSVTPTDKTQQAGNTFGHVEIVGKQKLKQRMPDQEIREVAKPDQTRPTRKSGSSLKRKPEASGAGSRKKRAMSDTQAAPPPIKRKSSSAPSDPKKVRAFGLPSMFRNNPHLPAYTLDGEVRYGVVEPSDEYLKFYDKAPANKDTNVAIGSTPQTPQASSSSTHSRVIRPTRSVKTQFGFSPLETISERSETAPSMRPAPPMRVPSRLFDRMNANKRKRWTSPESIPNPKGKSSGFGKAELYGNAEEDDIAGQQPGKVRRTSHLKNPGSQGTTNSVSSRPCTGPQSIIPNTPITITNKTGSFKVPSPGDSDWSDSQSEDEGFSQAATAQLSNVTNPVSTTQSQLRANAYEGALPVATTVVPRLEVNPTAAGQTFEAALDSSPPQTSRPRFTAFEDWVQTASPSVASALERMEVDSNAAGAAFQRGLLNQTTP